MPLEDSNPHVKDQSLSCCHYIKGQCYGPPKLIRTTLSGFAVPRLSYSAIDGMPVVVAERARSDRACVLPPSLSRRVHLPFCHLSVVADGAGLDPACVLPLPGSSRARLPVPASILLSFAMAEKRGLEPPDPFDRITQLATERFHQFSHFSIVVFPLRLERRARD